MTKKPRRIQRERTTIEAMIRIYCHDKHSKKDVLCSECKELLDYAMLRLDKCPFEEKKPTCANCRVHCYQPGMRERIKTVMRYSGPRMTYKHPLLAMYHLIDGRRKAPALRAGKQQAR